jgi:hypothetical protein
MDGYLLRVDELSQFTSTLRSFHPAQYYWFGRLALRCDLSRLFLSHLLHQDATKCLKHLPKIQFNPEVAFGTAGHLLVK